MKRHQESDPKSKPVLYNPDTRSKHGIIGSIRTLGKILGHKSKKKDPFQPLRELPKIDEGIEPSGLLTKISTGGSAIKNG